MQLENGQSPPHKLLSVMAILGAVLTAVVITGYAILAGNVKLPDRSVQAVKPE